MLKHCANGYPQAIIEPIFFFSFHLCAGHSQVWDIQVPLFNKDGGCSPTGSRLSSGFSSRAETSSFVFPQPAPYSPGSADYVIDLRLELVVLLFLFLYGWIAVLVLLRLELTVLLYLFLYGSIAVLVLLGLELAVLLCLFLYGWIAVAVLLRLELAGLLLFCCSWSSPAWVCWSCSSPAWVCFQDVHDRLNFLSLRTYSCPKAFSIYNLSDIL